MEGVAVDPGTLADTRAPAVPGATGVPLCGAPLALTVVDLGKSPLCESFLPAERLEAMEPFYPLHVARLHGVLARRSSRVRRRPRRSSPSTPTSRRTRTRGSSTRARYVEHDRRAARARRREPRRRARLERRLPAPALPAEGHPGARHRAGAERRRGGERARRPDARRVLRRRARPSGSSRSEGRRPTSCSATTCWPRCPTSTTSSAGVADPARAGRHGDVRVPAPRAADRGPPVRHDLPRALLVLLAHVDPRAIFAAHGLDGRRRRGAADPRRLAARLRRSTQASAARRRAAVARARSRARRRAGCATRSATARFAEERQGVEARAARAPDRASPRRASRSSATARRARGTRCSTTAASAPTSSTTRSTATRTSTGRFTPGTHIPIHPPERIAETRPDVIVILPWNLAREIAAQLAYTARVGREARRPDPDREVLEPGRCRHDPAIADSRCA